MRDDRLYLNEILEAAQSVARFLERTAREEFLQSELLQSAVLHKLILIGEAASRLSPDLRVRHPAVPWKQVTAMRNILIHQYFSVDWSIVWNTATQDLPELRRQISTVMEIEKG